MRTIDADALKDRLQALSYDDWNQGASTTWANAYAECADMVEDMPTIEPERKTGKWIKLDKDNMFFVPHMLECSICGNTLDKHGVNAGRGDANYCPNCGADMRGEQP